MGTSMLRFETAACRRGATRVAGNEEAGRGPLAGPVVSAAVTLPRDIDGFFRKSAPLHGLTDSKQLTAGQRDKYFEVLTDPRIKVQIGIGIGSVELVDQINILRATHWAMAQAIAQLPQRPDHLLVDGLPVPALPIPHTAIVGGDGKSYSIAAASVVAKVTRDRLMGELHKTFPHYNFTRHKGYATPEHLLALERFGPCPIHRKTFAPIRQLRLAFG